MSTSTKNWENFHVLIIFSPVNLVRMKIGYFEFFYISQHFQELVGLDEIDYL
jgi:predicted RNA-binding protein with PUA-like domain